VGSKLTLGIERDEISNDNDKVFGTIAPDNLEFCYTTISRKLKLYSGDRITLNAGTISGYIDQKIIRAYFSGHFISLF
jgi:hypothetical protein